RDDLRAGNLGAHRADDFQAVRLGDEEIHEQQVGAVLAVHAQRRGAVARLDYLVTGRLERDADRAPQQRVVLDDQDARHRAATRPARPAPGARAPPARKASGGRRPRTPRCPRTPTRTAPSSRPAAATAARPAAARSTLA